MIDDLKTARRLIHEAINDLENASRTETVSELLDACERIDEHYKECCEEIDIGLREKREPLIEMDGTWSIILKVACGTT
ncbi:hypothetical protein LCGC14_1637110 [marine sediment metagenome]|uniref:PhoU domain-containing protein n=1 Tax=marine sediment metagenome TaxID=412755 RepID=A0A0F9I176_9ZZZZ